MEIWSGKKTYGGEIRDISNCVQETFDGGFILAGVRSTATFFYGVAYLIKIDADGNKIWDKIYEGNSGMSEFDYVQQTKDNGYIATGSADGSNSRKNLYMVKTSPDGATDIKENYKESIENYSISDNYPNPFNPATTINYSVPKTSFVSIIVYDLLSREVAKLINEEKQPGNYEVKFDASNLSSGVYFYRMQAGDFVNTKKLVVLK